MRCACALSVCNSDTSSLASGRALYRPWRRSDTFFGKRRSCRFTPCGGTGTPREIVSALFHCAGGDILITTVTLASAAALAWHFHWRAFGLRMVFPAILLGAAYTVFSEWFNVDIRRSWSYTAAMPVLPVLGTGLTPLLQWVVVPGLAFAIVMGVGATPA